MTHAPQLTDLDLALLIIERDIAQNRKERIDELINKYGETHGLLDYANQQSTKLKNGETLFLVTDFNKLPSRSYKTKETATSNEVVWIFDNISDAEALLATLKSKNVKATIEGFEKPIQGNQHQFIARKPTIS